MNRSVLQLVAPRTALRRLFYVVWPEETQFDAVHEVPEYVDEAVPYFVLLMLLEMVLTAHRNFRVNDTLASLSSGLLLAVSQLFLRSVEFAGYVYVFEHWRVYELREGALTCALLFLGIDLLYYWFHRAAHEVNVLWAAHQVHHSSEEYNLSTALRQSVVQKWLNLLFYVPLALVAPPSFFVAHMHFNFVFQFWVHTRVVRSLGPLEWLLNTPSHHRVHHARNRYAIDKNYAGTLIIWDRLFGTFAAERFDDEQHELSYGLVHPITTFDPWSVQLCHYTHMARTLWHTAGWSDKLCVLLKGPGWSPGKPRLGLTEDLPEIRGARRVCYDPQVPPLLTAYCVLHFAGAFGCTLAIADNLHAWGAPLHAAATVHILLALTTVAWLLERRRAPSSFPVRLAAPSSPSAMFLTFVLRVFVRRRCAPFCEAARCALAAAALLFLRDGAIIRLTSDLQLTFFWLALGTHALSAAFVLLIALTPLGFHMPSEKRD